MESEYSASYGDVKKEKLYRRISFWLSIIVTTAIVVWYASSNPPDSPEVQRMRIFFKENIMEVTKFIKLGRKEQVAYAVNKKHPFFQEYVKSSEVGKEKIRALIHISTDYTPYQYWFNIFFLWVIFFTTFWFLGLVVEAIIILIRQSHSPEK